TPSRPPGRPPERPDAGRWSPRGRGRRAPARPRRTPTSPLRPRTGPRRPPTCPLRTGARGLGSRAARRRAHRSRTAHSPWLARILRGPTGIVLAIALGIAIALLQLVLLLLVLPIALCGGLLIGTFALGVLPAGISLFPGPAALAGFALAARALLALALVGVLAGFLVGLAPLVADALAVVVGGLGVPYAGAAFRLRPAAGAARCLYALLPLAPFTVVLASRVSGAGLHRRVALVEPLGAPGWVVDRLGLPLDSGGEGVAGLAPRELRQVR